MTGSAAPLLAAGSAVLAVVALALRRPVELPWPVSSPRRRRDVLAWVGGMPPRGGALRRRAAGGSGAAEARALGAGRLAALGMGGLALLAGAPLPVCVVLGLGARKVPVVMLARKASARRRAARRELPVFLDLVSSAVSVGLTGPLAVRHASEAASGPLAAELAVTLRRVELGGRWRDELVAAADRLDLPDLRRAVLVLSQGHRVGTSMSDALAELAREVREAHRAAAAERARTAPVKMLFPLVFLVLPAFLLLTVAPVLVATLQSIR